MQNWFFWPLQPRNYDVIEIDPPWTFQTYSKKGEVKSAMAQYRCMDLKDIKALPVHELAKPDCWLFLWATAPLLPQALDTLVAWGFRYKSHMVWRKISRAKRLMVGTGYIARSSHEIVLIGSKGSPPCGPAMPSVFDGVRRQHSRKPAEFKPLVEAFTPQARRCEIFSREIIPGWDSFGDQGGLFNVEINSFDASAFTAGVAA